MHQSLSIVTVLVGLRCSRVEVSRVDDRPLESNQPSGCNALLVQLHVAGRRQSCALPPPPHGCLSHINYKLISPTKLSD